MGDWADDLADRIMRASKKAALPEDDVKGLIAAWLRNVQAQARLDEVLSIHKAREDMAN